MKKNLILFVVLLVLAGVGYFLYNRSGKGTLSDKPLTEFAIADTSTINKIIITDHLGKQALLERVPGQKLWKLNNLYLAREDAVDLILLTINRIRIRGNVSDSARDNMMKLLATSGKRVEIFTGDEEPAKIYYVGVATPDHTGTIMLLEIPGIGRSAEPYITHIEGFTGFLNTRFFTDEMEWRYTGIFEYPQLQFSKVRMVNHLIPEQSFEVQFDGGNNIRFYDHYNPATGTFDKNEEVFDTIAVKDYLLLYRKIHVESYNTLLSKHETDSILALPPVYTVTVTDRNGKDTSIDLLLRPARKDLYDEKGERRPWDMDYYWAKTMSGELALAQSYNFAPLLDPAESFLFGKNNKTH